MYRILACWIALIFLAAPLAAQSPQHPLDALTFDEFWTVLEVLQSAGHLNDETRFPVVSLKEPSKDFVWRWSRGNPFPREATAVVRQGTKGYEAVIDISSRKLASWNEVRGGYPNFLIDEDGPEAGKEAKKHPDVIAALKRRGFADLTLVDCFGIPPGYFGTSEQRGKRVLHVTCMDPRRVRGLWAPEIPGLTIVYDADAKKVIRVVDEGGAPISPSYARAAASYIGARPAAPPMRVEQPQGAGFRLHGSEVEWLNWKFHVRHDQRSGAVISAVSWRQGAELRPVLYQGYLAEIFVPYMDPEFAWFHRNFLDAGEFNSGGLAKPLIPGSDCPEYAVFTDGLVSDGNGRPRTTPNAICMYEREAGDMAWRHHSSEPASLRKRDLVVRFAAVLGNYDYIFDWVFQQDGSIRVSIGATGIAETKSVAQATALPVESSSGGNGDGSRSPADAYGRFVDKNVVAVNHDHYFSFRLDLDVDGPANSFLQDKLVPKSLPADHPRRSLWVREPSIAGTENDAKLHMNMTSPSLWRVVSSSRKNHVGYPTSYQLMSGMNAHTLLSADDYPRRRAGFIDHHLWVTPHRPQERYAAGEYPTLSEPGQGLPDWTKANRPIRDTDIVLWHTVGMHHMVRGEDWPIMPVLWHSFELRPFDFFDRNPAVGKAGQ
jgi:primary-amine oxidase